MRDVNISLSPGYQPVCYVAGPDRLDRPAILRRLLPSYSHAQSLEPLARPGAVKQAVNSVVILMAERLPINVWLLCREGHTVSFPLQIDSIYQSRYPVDEQILPSS